jgi:hypothetical protein
VAKDTGPRKHPSDAEEAPVSAVGAVDVSARLLELEQLEHREKEVSALRRRLHDRLDSFANEVTLARERELSLERKQLHLLIDALRAELRQYL